MALATYDLEIVGPKNGKVLTDMPAMTVVDNESYRISTFNSTQLINSDEITIVIEDCSTTKFGSIDIRYKSEYAMRVMEKSGWAEGGGLGKEKQGDVDPIKVGRDYRAAVPPPANILKETVFYYEHGVAYDSKTFRDFCK